MNKLDRDSYLDENNVFSEVWKRLEDLDNYPSRLNKVVIKDYEGFNAKARSNNNKVCRGISFFLIKWGCLHSKKCFF